MVSILDDALLVSSDKHVVESNWDFSRPQYVVITSVTTSVSKSFDILRTGGGGNDNEKETVTFRARTDPCTYNSTTIDTDTFHKKDKNSSNSISSFEARENQNQYESEEHKNTKAIIAQKARTTKQQQRSSFRRHSLDSRHHNNTIIVIASSTQNKNDNNKNIIIATNDNDDEGNMVRFSTINDNPWWKEQEPHDDQDGADDLSRQMIRTTTNLGANKNNIDITPSHVHHQEEFGVEPFPKTRQD